MENVNSAEKKSLVDGFNKKITRKEFLKISLKIILLALLPNFNLLNQIVKEQKIFKNKFKIPLKKFSRSELYKNHKLAG